MWVFAYGSLMADGWERKHGCLFRSRAALPGYVRSFDKASIKARGSREHPAPTLRIVPSDGECQGVAFQFDDKARENVLRELVAREGKTFPLREKPVRIDPGRTVTALVPIYEGDGLLTGKSLEDLAVMAIRAQGTLGSGLDYVRDVARHLAEAGIQDAAVTRMLGAVEAAMANRST